MTRFAYSVFLLVLMYACQGPAAGSDEPTTYAISAECALHSEVIRDVFDAYCEQADKCLAEVTDNADITLQCREAFDIPPLPADAAGYAEKRVNAKGNVTHTVWLRISARSWEDLGLTWLVVAHEVGHAFGLEHSRNADNLMHDELPENHPLELDADILRRLEQGSVFDR